MNIKFVMGLGDLTWNGHKGVGNAAAENEFKTVREKFKIFDNAGVEYSNSYGNHDYTPSAEIKCTGI